MWRFGAALFSRLNGLIQGALPTAGVPPGEGTTFAIRHPTRRTALSLVLRAAEDFGSPPRTGSPDRV
jgi:hypothetical protein